MLVLLLWNHLLLSRLLREHRHVPAFSGGEEVGRLVPLRLFSVRIVKVHPARVVVLKLLPRRGGFCSVSLASTPPLPPPQPCLPGVLRP